MTEETLQQWQEQVQKAAEPVRRAQVQSIDWTRQIVEFQTQRGRAYADMAIQRARAALEVSDPGSLQAFLQEQGPWTRELVRQMGNDLHTLSQLGHAFGESLQETVTQGVTQQGTPAAEEAEAAGGPQPEASGTADTPSETGTAGPAASEGATGSKPRQSRSGGGRSRSRASRSGSKQPADAGAGSDSGTSTESS